MGLMKLSLDEKKQVAAVCRDTWRGLLGANQVALWPVMGNIAGESGFDVAARGDHDTACGLMQHHLPRLLMIREHTGIDLRAAQAADQCKAIWAEMTERWSPYRHVGPALQDVDSELAAVTILVRDYEQSRNQLSDIVKRLALGHLWKEMIGDGPPAA